VSGPSVTPPTPQDRPLVPIGVLDAQALPKLRADGDGPIVRGESSVEQTLALDYRCPGCARVLVANVDPALHPLQLHGVALRCRCGQYSVLPDEIW
jgi:hypothetical protein